MNVKMFEGKPGIHITLQIWFAQFWRMLLWLIPVFLVSVLASFIIAIVAGSMGGKPAIEAMKPFATGVGAFIGLLGGFWVWHKSLLGVLGKTFLGYRLVLLTPESTKMVDDAGG